jgi:hypothetical protein
MKTSITTIDTTKAKIEALKGENLTYTDVLEYLLSLNNFKQDLSGSLKVELLLKQWLHLGHDRKITQTDIQRVTGCNLNTIKKIIELYTIEIEQHNAKYE